MAAPVFRKAEGRLAALTQLCSAMQNSVTPQSAGSQYANGNALRDLTLARPWHPAGQEQKIALWPLFCPLFSMLFSRPRSAAVLVMLYGSGRSEAASDSNNA